MFYRSCFPTVYGLLIATFFSLIKTPVPSLYQTPYKVLDSIFSLNYWPLLRGTMLPVMIGGSFLFIYYVVLQAHGHGEFKSENHSSINDWSCFPHQATWYTLFHGTTRREMVKFLGHVQQQSFTRIHTNSEASASPYLIICARMLYVTQQTNLDEGKKHATLSRMQIFLTKLDTWSY